jgi:hypothetical protein
MFRQRNPHFSPTRFDHILPEKRKDQYKFFICSFQNQSNDNGVDLRSLFGSDYGDLSSAERVFDMFSEIFSCLSHLLSPSFSKIKFEFLEPARDIAADAPPSVIFNLLCQMLSTGLSIVTPLKIPISEHIDNFVSAHSLKKESHAIYFRDYLNSQILTSLSKQAALQAQTAIDRPKQQNGNGPKNGNNRNQRGTSPSPRCKLICSARTTA